MGYQRYIEKKQLVIKQLQEAKGLVNQESLQSLIDDKIKNLEDDRFIISVFGHFSNGKSTFLNALMGFSEEVLVENELASTATITRLKYPTDLQLLNQAQIVFNNGLIETVPIKDIRLFSATNQEVNVERDIREVILYLDSPLLKNGVEIVDTPGFNSTYKIHTEIAKQYVEQSDACIFLFTYDKPGSQEEFKFLQHIREKMERVFLVLNKIDKMDSTECVTKGLDYNISELKKKIAAYNVNVLNKEVYPISSLLMRQGLKENSNEKIEYSKFLPFESALANYLTSDENTYDRLVAPLTSLLSKLSEEKEILNRSISVFNTDKEALDLKIKQNHEEIEFLEKEIRQKQKHLNMKITTIMDNGIQMIETQASEQMKDIFAELDQVQSKFSILMTDFRGINEDLLIQLNKIWIQSIQRMEYLIINAIDEVIDYDQDPHVVKEKIDKIIMKTLQVSLDDVQNPKFNFDVVNELDKEIREKEEIYYNARQELNRLADDKKRYDDKKLELLNYQNELKRLKEERHSSLMGVLPGQRYQKKDTNTDYVKRRGLCGAIGNLLFGAKQVTTIVEEWDDTDVLRADQEKKRINEDYEKMIDEVSRKADSISVSLYSSGNIDFKLDEARLDVERASHSYFKNREIIEEQKREMTQEVIHLSKTKYKRDIRNAIEMYLNEVNIYLEENKKNIYKVAVEALEGDLKRLDMLQQQHSSIILANELSPEQINAEIKRMYEELMMIDQINQQFINLKEKI
ncbi:GTP-binding protein Der [Turicibacter sanguinis]|nr:GTP-binding protein Der [Turicibacter sanguinis]